MYEHKQSGFDAIKCWGVQKVGGFKTPEEMLVYKITRSEQQRRDDRREEKKRRREKAKEPEPAPRRIAHTPFKYPGSGGGSLCARWVGTHQHPAIPNFDSEIGYPLLDF